MNNTKNNIIVNCALAIVAIFAFWFAISQIDKVNKLEKSVFIACRKTDWATGDKCRKITEEVLKMSDNEVNSYTTVFGNY